MYLTSSTSLCVPIGSINLEPIDDKMLPVAFELV